MRLTVTNDAVQRSIASSVTDMHPSDGVSMASHDAQCYNAHVQALLGTVPSALLPEESCPEILLSQMTLDGAFLAGLASCPACCRCMCRQLPGGRVSCSTGGRADSYYEYLLKTWLLRDKRVRTALDAAPLSGHI